MKKIVKKLILYYLIFVIVKSIISYFIPSPSAFSDEYIYAKLARSVFYDSGFIINGIQANTFLPIYPSILSISYFFDRMIISYPIMKILNSVMSSLIIFPAFLIAKEFFNNNRSLKLAVLISILPSNFIFSSYLLAENLFYPLFLFSVYFIYKTYTSQKIQWPILAGIFIGLTYLTRIIGIILFGVVILVFLFKLIKREKINFFHILLIFLIAASIMAPWLIRNYFIQKAPLGGYTAEVLTVLQLTKFLPRFIVQFILYSGLLVISTGILFPMFISKKIFNKKFITFTATALSSIFLALLVGANHNLTISLSVLFDIPAKHLSWLGGRLIGRYIDAVLPLIIILGMICIREKVSFKKTILFSGILIFASQTIFSQLFPVNHISTAHLGTLNLLITNFTSSSIGIFPINLILIAIILGIIPFILYKIKFNFNKIITLFSILFILVNLTNFALIHTNTNTYWYKGEQMQLGIWLDSYDLEVSNVLFDKRDCTGRILKLDQSSLCEPSGVSTIIGFWLNDNIIVENPDNLENIDFIISRHEFPFPIVKSSKDNIYIYSLKGN